MLHTASETATRTRWRLREGVRFLRPGSVSPGPQVHAYRAGEASTLCALPLDLLLWEQFHDLDFTAVPLRDRCRSCSALADSTPE
jgi:hypothetical protein